MRKLTLSATLFLVIILTAYLPKNRTNERVVYGLNPVVTDDIKYWESLSVTEKRKLYHSNFKSEEDFVGYLTK